MSYREPVVPEQKPRISFYRKHSGGVWRVTFPWRDGRSAGILIDRLACRGLLMRGFVMEDGNDRRAPFADVSHLPFAVQIGSEFARAG